VLDVMLKPGFFEHAQKMSLLLKQKLASAVDRHPTCSPKCAARAC
jgi:acetylornithine/N-succinyldiaminopimelate aminotransferase